MRLPAFYFATATKIRFGQGEGRQAVPDLSQIGQCVLLVHGASAARLVWLRDALKTEHCAVVGFTVSAEPDTAMIAGGVATAREAGGQAVTAIGGGAVIDGGKAIAAFVSATRPIPEHLEVVGQGLPLDEKPLPFAALPTTAQTEAELTRNAVIYVPDAHRKVYLRDVRMLSYLAVVDPSLTDDCPRAVTLTSCLEPSHRSSSPIFVTGPTR